MKVSKGLLKPNVLITGITGAGKSSLINAIFGKNVAETGTGVPLTQHFTKYESDDMRVVIYDSKGLEHGEFEDFMNTTDHFFESHKPGTVSETDTIHVVWYIVNSAHSRWEPFEEVICRKLLNRAPLMFVLNKADISSPRDRKGMKKLIHDMRLPHCKGVFETIAQPTAKLKNFEVCPECGSDDLVVRTKLASMRCEACGHMESLQQVDGLAELIEATCKVIPDVLKGAFISAQNVNFHLKEEHSRKILTEFWGAFAQVRTPTKLLKVVAQMMAKLSIIWEFKRRGQEYGFFMAKDLVSAFTWKEKLNLLFQNKIEVQRTHITALGILWYRCLRTFTWELLRIWSQNSHNKQQTKEKKSKTTTNSKLNESCSLVFKQIFSHLTEQNILSIETAIQHKGLEPVLNEDMKWTDEEIDE
uniref:G domain-containing protein n=1 Tax=Arcella intermedia TaxID=1963864 RepID=A0A6B2L5C1_9EUKA